MEDFELVADWADRKGVAYGIVRQDETWVVRLRFKDAHGEFTGDWIIPARLSVSMGGKTRKETDDEFYKRISTALSTACAKARAARIAHNAKAFAAGRAA